MKKPLVALVCIAGCLCSGSLFAFHKTPGEKLDNAIDKTKEKAEDAKDVVKEKCEDAKDAAKKEIDKERQNIADKVTPGR
jgi:uncharacterized protein YjbJ (UPF0337 family)